MARNNFLYVYGVSSEQWAKRFGLEPFTYPCSECGIELTTTIPFAYDQLRGLAAPTCACGNEKTPYCLVRDPKFGDLLDWP